MSLICFSFASQILSMEQTVYMVLPEAKRDSEVPYFHPGRDPLPRRFPTLYLLHGTSQDESEWLRFTGIERYANQKGIAVVMPSGQLSAYTDMVYGERWMTYLAEELPQRLERLFPLSGSGRERFLCGLSMGGYGAAKIGLTFPRRYRAIGSLSNGNHAYKRVLDAAPGRADAMPGDIVNQRHWLCWGLGPGQSPVDTPHDLYALAKANLPAAGPLPALFHMVGTADRNLKSARHMRDFFRSLPDDPYRYTYFEQEMGDHTWQEWDRWIEIFLQWLPADRTEGCR